MRNESTLCKTLGTINDDGVKAKNRRCPTHLTEQMSLYPLMLTSVYLGKLFFWIVFNLCLL